MSSLSRGPKVVSCSLHPGVQIDMGGGGVIGASGGGGNRQWGMALSMARNIFDNN